MAKQKQWQNKHRKNVFIDGSNQLVHLSCRDVLSSAQSPFVFFFGENGLHN